MNATPARNANACARETAACFRHARNADARAQITEEACVFCRLVDDLSSGCAKSFICAEWSSSWVVSDVYAGISTARTSHVL
jgi:hypothetical protein